MIMKQITFVIFAILIGFIFGAIIYKATNKTQNVNKAQETKASLPSEFVLNPVVEEFIARIDGTVISKTKDSFILEKNGNRATLHIEPRGITTFVGEKGGETKELDFNQVEAGDYLNGGVSVIVSVGNAVGRTGNRKPGDIIAHYFSVTHK